MCCKSSHWLFVLQLQRIPFILITSEESWQEEGKSYFSQLCVYLHRPDGQQGLPGGVRRASAQDCPARQPLPDVLHFDNEKIREETEHSNAMLAEEAALVVV